MQRRVLIVVFCTLLLDMISVGIIFPIIPILFTDPTSHSFLLIGYSRRQQLFAAGLITAVFGLMQFIAAPILGELSDIYGRKRLLTLGVGVLAISQLVFGFGIQMASLGLLFVSRVVAGIAGANISIAQAAIADVTETANRARNFGLIGSALGVGFIVGPVVGGWITSIAGNASAPFWFAGALGVCNVLFITFALPETHKVAQIEKRKFHLLKGLHNIRDALRDVDVRTIYMANFLYMSGFAFFTSFIGVLLVTRFHFSEAGIGTFFGIVGVWVVLTQAFILRVVTRMYSERAIVRYSLPVLACGMMTYPFLPDYSWLFILIPFVAVSQGLSMPNMTALVSKGVSTQKQGAALGINGSLIALSQGVIPLVAGLASGTLGIMVPFISAGVLVFISWSVLFVFSRR